jgi:hypothetical protein
MRPKLTIISILVTLVLFLAACTTSTNQGPTLTVTGTGTVYLSPDIAYVDIGVHTENTDIAQAVESNNSLAQAVVDALRNSGVDAKDLQTSNFSVYSTTQTDQLIGKPTGTNYSVDNSVSVTVRDLSKLARSESLSDKRNAPLGSTASKPCFPASAMTWRGGTLIPTAPGAKHNLNARPCAAGAWSPGAPPSAPSHAGTAWCRSP